MLKWTLLIVAVIAVLAAIALWSTGLHRAGSARIQLAGPSDASVHRFTLSTATGQPAPLSAHAGQVVLLVNTASKCGYTVQYDGLEALHRRWQDRGLRVLAVPSNDFLGQEPGGNAEIQEFCRLRHGLTFPVLAKERVLGSQAHPLFRWLQDESPTPGRLEWNFVKVVIDRAGRVVARFGPRIAPDHPELLAALERALGAT